MRESCVSRLGDPPELSPPCLVMWSIHLVRDEVPKAYELGEELLRRAQSMDDAVPLLYAHYALGDTSYIMAEFLPLGSILKWRSPYTILSAIGHCAFRYLGTDVGVPSLSFAAQILWQLGYSDQAADADQ